MNTKISGLKFILQFPIIFGLLTGCSAKPTPPKLEFTQALSTPMPLATLSGKGGGIIAYASDKSGGRMDLYLVNADGSNPTQITFTKNDEFAPAWSPDGSKLAYLQHKNNQIELRVLDLNKAISSPDLDQSHLLSSRPLHDSPPSWSPDGERLVFSAYVDGITELFSIRADGSEEIRLTATEFSEQYPSWSPVSNQLVFSSNQSGPYNLILVDNFTGDPIRPNNQIQLTTGPGNEYQACWSPNGERILFTSSEFGNKDIFIINADGNDLRQLTDNPADEWKPSWSPYGAYFIYSYFNFDISLHDLLISTIKNGNPIQITDDNFDNWWPDWKP